MSIYHFQEKSFSDREIVASCIEEDLHEKYAFKHIEYPDLYIPNRSLAWHIYYLDEESPEKSSLKSAVNEYNDYLTKLEKIPGFLEFFIENGLCVSKESISKRWSDETAMFVFSKKNYVFSTDLQIENDCLFDISHPSTYSAGISKCRILIPIGASAESYPESINKKTAIWNWIENGHDLCYGLWKVLGERYRQNEESADDEDEVHYYFDAYDQFRHEAPEPQLVRIFHKLEELGYIETYTIRPDRIDLKWSYFGKSDASVDVAIVDTSFLKNSLVMEQIELLLWQHPALIEDRKYFLTDKNGKQYLSDKPGAFGGHNKLKIYGRLDCPSAARYIAKGQYIRHRVFFKDESVAISAGYRPCAKCMPDAYKQWNDRTKAEGIADD